VKRRISRTGRACGRNEDRLAPALLIFLHIPKTAGRTLLGILERQYGSNAVLDLYDSSFGDGVASLTPAQIGSKRVIAGHFYFGVHNHLPGPFRYLTFLRDPVERVTSHYDFVRRQPDHYLYEAASAMSLPEYVQFCGGREPNNDQTRLLAGSEMVSSDGTAAPAMLPAAKRNLDRHAAVGLTEAFDVSLALMRRTFGWQRPFYVSRNISGRTRTAAPPDVLELIRAYNTLDVELYGYARERFLREVAEQGRALALEVRVFRKLNPLYGKLQSLTSGSPLRRRLASGA
jgi:hypothetical protein